MKIIKGVKNGFTLIELMITVAIVGILAAIALPAYQDYTIRAQVSEGITIVGGLQDDIQEYFAQNGTMPASNWAVPTAMPVGKYAYVNNIQNGLIIVRFGSGANSKLSRAMLAIEAVPDANGSIHWKCGNFAMIAPQWLPAYCHDTIDLNGYGG
ncbi:pilin [Burkholderia multivorans]|uniref:pilin n=1 Tax=Burkholderia multivorans TaxID=87883 RepID=UPI0015E470EA|nr:pilin [Burkholderia multivorans]